MLLNEDRNGWHYQTYSHPSLDLAQVIPAFHHALTGPAEIAARIYLPEIRVRSCVVLAFECENAGLQRTLDLRINPSEVVGYAGHKGRTAMLQVGEIWGKHGIPLVFPKSKIHGIKLETEEWCQWIDIEAKLGNPQVAGRWSLFYQATSTNKLKYDEWQAYISRVTAEITNGPQKMYFNAPG